MRETLTDAGWGALVTLALSMIPFSSLAGVAAMVPLLALFVPALYVSGLFGFGSRRRRRPTTFSCGSRSGSSSRTRSA
ncbi:hypothetical protein [Haloarcula nitratireducens]|uniref:hypothetical protein n=1 Tax=Haloarcula nitratireducens TaxID=2487749 RepID=UPI001F35F26E|nr:hypothetical protein [Halomicroarcula nitratireducens]